MQKEVEMEMEDLHLGWPAIQRGQIPAQIAQGVAKRPEQGR
jgi:hypothetical protein